MCVTTPPIRTESVLPDGNCFFRAISYWITGTCDQHAAVRALVVAHMRSNWREHGRRIVGCDLLEYIRQSKMENKAVWATENEIFACADLLQTTIFVYSDVGSENRWVPHNPSSGKSSKCIYLSNINHHFEPVTSVKL